MFIPTAEFTHKNAAQQLAAGLAAITAGQTTVSFEQTSSVDSSAVACMLAWQRLAVERGSRLQFEHIPVSLHNLIELYGVTEFV